MRVSMRIVLAALVLAACATGGSGGPGAPRRNPDVITAEEVAAAHVQTAYDAVSQLRPGFLASQGSTTQDHVIQVIVDDVPRGGVSVLRSINAGEVREIRRLTASEATQLWGTGYTGGAIVVRTIARGG